MRRQLLLYPFFVAAYPVLALLGANLGEVDLPSGLRPLAISMALLLLGLVGAWLIVRDWARAAALASLGFLLFFSYGHVYALVERLNATGLVIGRHRYLLPLWVVLYGAGAWWILRARSVRGWTQALNLVAGIALAIPAVRIVGFTVRSGARETDAATLTEQCSLSLPKNQPAPDIYYIILDGYMRDDILREVSGFDNSAFLDSLSGMGFVVARESQSNYPSTGLSLSSSLNMDYVDSLGWEDAWEEWDQARPLIVHSRLRRELECLGYKTVALETGYYLSEWTDADYYLTPYASAVSRFGLRAGITEFEYLWIRTSVGVALLDAEKSFSGWLAGGFEARGQEDRERILFTLQNVGGVAQGTGPKLVFVHVNAPHTPFVFGKEGEAVFVERAEAPSLEEQPAVGHPYWKAYANQVEYLNGLVLKAVKAILANSDTPPIILLQGDHGFVDFPHQAKVLILNAYYLPGEGAQRIYPSISPVNTFRVVLDEYLGGHYDLLPDLSYYPVSAAMPFEQLPSVWGGLQ
jgi:hypothetical protein